MDRDTQPSQLFVTQIYGTSCWSCTVSSGTMLEDHEYNYCIGILARFLRIIFADQHLQVSRVVLHHASLYRISSKLSSHIGKETLFLRLTPSQIWTSYLLHSVCRTWPIAVFWVLSRAPLLDTVHVHSTTKTTLSFFCTWGKIQILVSIHQGSLRVRDMFHI